MKLLKAGSAASLVGNRLLKDGMSLRNVGQAAATPKHARIGAQKACGGRPRHGEGESGRIVKAERSAAIMKRKQRRRRRCAKFSKKRKRRAGPKSPWENTSRVGAAQIRVAGGGCIAL